MLYEDSLPNLIHSVVRIIGMYVEGELFIPTSVPVSVTVAMVTTTATTVTVAVTDPDPTLCLWLSSRY